MSLVCTCVPLDALNLDSPPWQEVSVVVELLLVVLPESSGQDRGRLCVLAVAGTAGNVNNPTGPGRKERRKKQSSSKEGEVFSLRRWSSPGCLTATVTLDWAHDLEDMSKLLQKLLKNGPLWTETWQTGPGPSPDSVLTRPVDF